MGQPAIDIKSEIGPLKRVLLHRPGGELENLMPEYLERLLFDDIPYLKIAQEEHDAFCGLLRDNGVEVVYLTDLVSESLTDGAVKEQFVRAYIAEAGVRGTKRTAMIADHFLSMSTHNMVSAMMAGLRKAQVRGYGRKNLTDYLEDDYPFVLDPIPNLYFTRDPFAAMGNGVTIHRMHTVTRRRETLFAQYIFAYHPQYKGTPVYYDRAAPASIEGGDILVLSPQVVAIGISQRTQPWAIEQLAKRLLSPQVGFTKVLAFDIPKNRAFMHLDTVFTMVDHDKFTMHPGISSHLRLFVLELEEGAHLSITEEEDSLENILKEHLNLDSVTLLKCGGGSVIDAAREQWNDGSNTFCLAPGRVVAYSRNHVTNRVMEEAGIEVLTIPSSELSRGRGGPRCMTMPLVRGSI